MTDDDLLDALYKLLPAQIDDLVARSGMPAHLASGSQTPVATRARELLQWADAAGRRAEVEARCRALLGLPSAPKAEVGPVVSIARLPATSGVVFGREADLAWLDACWKEGAHVATVVAWGGVGKTALVNKWLAGLRDKGWDGAERVYGWSFYSQGTDRLSSSDEFIDAALRWFGDPDPKVGSAWDRGERLAGLVRKHKSILILDGVEPLQWGPGVQPGKLKDPALKALLKELAAQNMGTCLITSRIGLTDLDALGGDKVRTRELNNLSSSAGAELLKARGVKGTDDELRSTSEEYRGHGLALTLLGSYLAEVSEGDIRQRKEIGPLEEAEQHGHARRVMKSYEPLLGKFEAAILYMIGLFDRPANEDEIDALRAEPMVPGLTDALVGISERDWNRAIAKLRKVGLLSVEQDKRLDAHPLVREHFGEQLKRKQPEAWREGHRRLYEHLRGQLPRWPETAEEIAPLYVAVMHGCLAEKKDEALVEVWQKHLNHGEGGLKSRRHGGYEREIVALSFFFDSPWTRLAPGLSGPCQEYVLTRASFALEAAGRLPEAAALKRRSLGHYLARGEWEQAASSASALGRILKNYGELSEALAQARKGVELAERCGYSDWHRTTLATILHAMGFRKEAKAHFNEAERQVKKLGTTIPPWIGISCFEYCDFLLDEGGSADAARHAQASLRLLENNDSDVRPIAVSQLAIGRIGLLAVGRGLGVNDTWASWLVSRSIDSLRHDGDQTYLPFGLLTRAAVHSHTRAFDLARRDLDEALALATRCEFRLHQADAHLGHARLALAEKDRARAQPHLAKARAIITQTGYHRRDDELTQLEAEAAEMAKTAPPLPAAPPPPPLPAPQPSTAKPMTTTATESVDIGVVVALKEETRELLALVAPHAARSDGGMNSYVFSRGAYRCVVTMVGAMGETEAARVTERQIANFDPGTVITMGISGGVHEDLRVGDVYVPPQAVQYMQDGKAGSDGKGGFAITPGAPASRADNYLHTLVTGFDFNHPEAHERWRDDCLEDLGTLLPNADDRERLFAGGIARRAVEIRSDGHEASGPVVGASSEFSAWIRSHDRNVKAIDMESAAVLVAAQHREHPKRALVIRGISDNGDPRKKEFDALGDGALRKYAMRNAVRLLLALLDVEAFPKNPR